jgi:hypothetical protein
MIEEEDCQPDIDSHMRKHSDSLLTSMLSHINSNDSKHEVKVKEAINKNKRKDNPDALKSLKIISKLMILQ